MNCEICGRLIRGSGFRIVMDGARLLVCEHCKGYGTSLIGLDKGMTNKVKPAIRAKPLVRVARRSVSEIPRLEVVEDFPAIVKEARLRLGFTQKELAAKISERVSVIQKVELGKLSPDLRLARKLERSLRVNLITQEEDLKMPASPTGRVERTLGDVVRIKRRNK